MPGKLCFTSFAFAFCVFKIEISTKLFQRKGFSSIRLGSSKKETILGTCVWTKKFYPPKRCFVFFSYFKTLLCIFMARNYPFLRKNFNFKPHIETCLSLWYGLCRKRCTGEKRTWASTTLREVAWCIIPGWAGDQSLFGKEARLIKRKDNRIMKDEKHCQNQRQILIDIFIWTENSAKIF